MFQSKRRYITGFDGLRALAVIAVILYHLNTTVFKGGFLGVPVFMGISGYLITDHLFDEYEMTGRFDYLNFWGKRIRRLYPTLLAMLLGTSAYIFLFARNLLYQLWQIVLTNLIYVYNWWQIIHQQSYFQQFAGNQSPFTHLWTLSIEGQFYLFWPLLAVLLMKIFKHRNAVFLAAIILAAFSAGLMCVLYVPNSDPSRLYYGTDTRMFSILLGAALAVVWPSKRLSKQIGRAQKLTLEITGAVAFGGMLYFLLAADGQSVFIYYGGMLLFSLLTTLMIAVVAQPASNWNRILTNRLFSWLGSRSYAIYVYQLPVMVFFEAKFTNLATHPVLYPLTETLIILVLSELSYRLIEKPARHGQGLKKIVWKKQLNFGSLKSKSWRLRHSWQALLLIVAVTGVVGIIDSTFVISSPTEHSALAQKLAENSKNQQKVDQAKSKPSRSLSATAGSTATKQSSSSAATSSTQSNLAGTVTSFEKYGISQAQLQQAQKLPLTAIGDSVMLASQPELSQIFPKMYINAVVGRQAKDAAGYLKELAAKHLLAKKVLIGLGTNGPIQPAEMQAVMSTVGSHRQVYWINVRVPSKPWQNQVNNFLQVTAHKYPNLKVIDWYGYSNSQPSWFYSDQTHPNNTGELYYTAFVAKTILADPK
jgi:peptidoglycan/LPS O-acetylase OafA/YrhL